MRPSRAFPAALTGSLTRRGFCRTAAGLAAVLLPAPLAARLRPTPHPDWAGLHPTPDEVRLTAWTAAIRAAGLAQPEGSIGRAAVGVGRWAEGTPYQPGTLEAYLRDGGSPAREPLTASLTRFDCVTLVESCLAVARVAVRVSRPT